MAKEAKDVSPEEQAEKDRVKAFQEAAESDREEELARREAHKLSVKRAQAESIISHGPVRS